MSSTTVEKLAAAGYSMQEAYDFVHTLLAAGRSLEIAQRAAELGLSAKDLAEISYSTKQDVVSYFLASGVDLNLLNAEKTGLSLVADLDGTIFLYDPNVGKGKPVFSFGARVWDIATDSNGDVYAQTDQGLLRYDFGQQRVEHIGTLHVGDLAVTGTALAFVGESLVSAASPAAVVVTFDKSGQALQDYALPPVGDEGQPSFDMVVIGNQLFRSGRLGLMQTDIITGESTLVTDALGARVTGLADGGNGWLIAYGSSTVAEFNIETHELRTLPPFGGNTGLSFTAIEGASEARQMHVDLWGWPL